MPGSALDLARVGFARWDVSDCLMGFNKTYVSMIYEDQQHEVRLGRPFRDMAMSYYALPHNIPPGRTPEEMLKLRLKGHESGSSLFDYQTSKHWFRVAEQKLSDGTIVGLYIDITDEKRNEQTARESERRVTAALHAATQANRAKSHFLAHMSHELRTPLNAIIGFAEMVAGEHVGPGVSQKYRTYADNIASCGHHLLTLINDILDLSKIEAGKMELAEGDFSLADLAMEATSMMDRQFQARKQRLVFDPQGINVKIHADRPKLLQILLNLLGNAHKFAPEEGSVALRGRRTGEGDVVIEVADDGPGMTLEEIETAWTPFGRSEGAFTTMPGTGLGLPISRRLAELHGGNLEIESERGHGTIVRLLLPNSRIRPG